MSYLVLARRLRPSRFDDLVGQENNSKILRNAVLTNRVAHAFLFAGSRGVGKTSAARILARAINCLNSENGNPCNNCEICIDINNNASPDIIEIDAASNRGIDNIRELRENVNYVPSKCRYKVYIIDEAHMLTLESFNALLKTLEEPPQYVKFIFATTDPHKVPQTIISRCQRYDFLRISVKQISDYLEQIIENENVVMTRNSLEMIAQNSLGGMRDALTALDQILSIKEGELSDREVAQILGILDHEYRFTFIEALLQSKDDLAIIHFQKLQEHGYDINDILSDLLNTIKTIALIQSLGKKLTLFQDIPSDELEHFQKLAVDVEADKLQQIFQILLHLEERLKVSSHAKICFEMAILQITSIHSLVGINEIIGEIKNIRDIGLSKKKNDKHINYSSNKISNNQSADEFDLSKNTINSEDVEDKEDLNLVGNNLNQKRAGEYQDDTNDGMNQIFEGSEKKDSIQDQNIDIQNDKIKVNFKENELNFNGNVEDEISKNDKIKNSKLSKNKIFDSIGQNLQNEKDSSQENYPKIFEKPPEEWFKFSEEAQKISPKIASFVRNAIPESLSASQINLSFKSGNYATLIDQSSIEALEKIASDLSGHSIQILCNGSETTSTNQTIAEYHKFELEEERKVKQKKAVESTQVNNILSVFKNSKISEIKFSDE